MRKIFIYFFIIFCLIGNTHESYSQGKLDSIPLKNTPSLDSINNFINKYLKITNEHNIAEINKIYALNYVSGDGLKKDDITKLIKDTWIAYPDLKNTSVIKDIRVNEAYAAIETYDKSCGSTANKSDITNDSGLLDSESHNIIYLQKFGKDWKIITDKVIYEKTTIKFGSAKPLNVNFYAPEQVLAGNNYTASLNAEVPDGMIALGSITREPIVYPETKPEEVYRQVNPATNSLERLFLANTTNNNELVTASIGYTEVTEDVLANPEVKLTGLTIVLLRVNVIPQSQFVPRIDKLKIEPDIETDLLPEKSNNKDLEKKE